MNNTQMTRKANEVLEKLSGWVELGKYLRNLKLGSGMPYISRGADGETWVTNDHGVRLKKLDVTNFDKETFVRECQ